MSQPRGTQACYRNADRAGTQKPAMPATVATARTCAQ